MNTSRSVGILAGIVVSKYQESCLILGVQVMTEHFGPNAIHLPTNHDHKHADTTKKIFISFFVSQLCTRLRKSNYDFLIKNDYISKTNSLKYVKYPLE